MEPIAAFGLACNVFQAIDLGLKSIALCKEIYNRGTPDKIQQLKDDIAIFKEADNKLRNCHNSIPRQLTSEDKTLCMVATTCIKIASDLESELEKFQLKGSNRIIGSITVMLKLIWSKKLDKLQKQLSEQRNTLQQLLLRDISRRQQAHAIKESSEFDELDVNLRNLVAQINANTTQIKVSITEELAKTRGHLSSEGAHTRSIVSIEGRQTRDYVSKQLQKLELRHVNQAQRDQLLASLRYNEINQRYSDVIEAHQKTLKWVFDETKQHEWDPFPSWLRTGEGTYWISGKAGSGKSTLMKYIFKNPTTREILNAWAGPFYEPVMISFFFWLSGASLQQSIKGLLASLLLQLLQKVESEVVCDLLIRELPTPKLSISDWSIRELQDALQCALQNVQRPLCIFLDGLDEFDPQETSDTIVSLIARLQAVGRVKFVVSSRPETSIIKAYTKVPKLKLQSLNYMDIRTFAEVSIRQIFSTDDFDEAKVAQLDRLALSIAEKSRGVFLWVSLAVKSVSRGLTAQDDIHELRKRVDLLPRGMTELYHNMWKRLNEDEILYREDAARFFNLILCYRERHESPSLLDVTIAVNESIQAKYIEKEEKLSDSEIVRKCEEIRVKLLVRCAGLLEVNQRNQTRSPSGDPFTLPVGYLENSNLKDPERCFDTRIEFIHRSAQDFLRNTTAGQEILHFSPITWLEFSMTSIRSKLVLLLENHRYFSYFWLSQLFRDYYSPQLVPRDEKKYLDCLLSIERFTRRMTLKPHYPGIAQEFVGCAAESGCFPAVRAAISNMLSVVEIRAEFWNYLLACTLLGIHSTNETDYENPVKGYHQIDQILWLLNHGANPAMPDYSQLSGYSNSYLIADFLAAILNRQNQSFMLSPTVMSVLEKMFKFDIDLTKPIIFMISLDELMGGPWLITQMGDLQFAGVVYIQLTVARALDMVLKLFPSVFLRDYLLQNSQDMTWKVIMMRSPHSPKGAFWTEGNDGDALLQMVDTYFTSGVQYDDTEQVKWMKKMLNEGRDLAKKYGVQITDVAGFKETIYGEILPDPEFTPKNFRLFA